MPAAAPELLAALTALDAGQGVALTRLAKHLGLRVSVLLRDCSLLSDARLGGVAGPGWVRLVCDEGGRWSAHLTDSGRAQAMPLHEDDDEPQSPAPVQTLAVQRLDADTAQDHLDQIAVETPVALVFNGISHAVMMATPTDLEAFGLGFALSEGLLATRADCHGIELRVNAEGCELHLQVAASAEQRLKEQRRSMLGRTGCGLCGIDSLRRLDLAPAPLTVPSWVQTLQAGTVLGAFEQLPARQPLNTLTGAHHAAGWVSPAGELLAVMEDVGRHNALDKLLGQRLLQRQALDAGFVIMSSRASYELVLKCARLGVPALATISAPTSLAVQLARQSGLRLYGFCRGTQAVRYA